jgi:hypothetical protein
MWAGWGRIERVLGLELEVLDLEPIYAQESIELYRHTDLEFFELGDYCTRPRKIYIAVQILSTILLLLLAKQILLHHLPTDWVVEVYVLLKRSDCQLPVHLIE